MHKIIELAKDNKTITIILSGFIMLMSLYTTSINGLIIFLIYLLWIAILAVDLIFDYIPQDNAWINMIDKSFWRIFIIFIILLLICLTL